MATPDCSRAALEQALGHHGLQLRGGFVPVAQDGLPALPGGRVAAVVWLVAQVGSALWPHFSASAIARDGLPDPLDRWSQSIADRLARDLEGVALLPSNGPPYHPFQRWARRIEGLHASPLMLQLHPTFGLWHAYRFALALPDLDAADAAEIAHIAALPSPDLCLACDGQPCLQACPVEAFDGQGYAVDRCGQHLHGPDAEDCNTQGCLARRACPVGEAYRYVPAHAAFHMAAFTQRH